MEGSVQEVDTPFPLSAKHWFCGPSAAPAGPQALEQRQPADRSDLLDSSRRLLAALPREGLKLEVDRRGRSLQGFSVFDGVPQGYIDRLVSDALHDERAGRAIGAIVGMAVGDAIGAPLEFLPAGTSLAGKHRWDPNTFEYTNEFNKFGLKRGQWTDDSSMGLCMADSFILNLHYDGSDMRVRFWNWWYMGYNNAFRKDMTRSGSVGLGGNISCSLRSIKGSSPSPVYQADGEDAGNGSLMRLAPVPIFFHRDPVMAMEWSSESSYTTHPGPMAAAACGFLGYAVARAIGGSRGQAEEEAFQTAASFLDMCVEEYLEHKGYAGAPSARHPKLCERRVMWKLLKERDPPSYSAERCWDWRNPAGPFIKETLRNRGKRYNGYPVSDTYFGSYSIDALAIALHCVYHTSNFMDAVDKCVNLLGDADSTGSITGQLAGAFYGHRAIDQRCIENLNRWDDNQVALRGAMLYALGGELYQRHDRRPPRVAPHRRQPSKSQRGGALREDFLKGVQPIERLPDQVSGLSVLAAYLLPKEVQAEIEEGLRVAGSLLCGP